MSTDAVLTNEEREICEARLGALRDRLNDSKQFEGLIALGVDDIAIWNQDNVGEYGLFSQIKLSVVFDSSNNDNDGSLRVTREALNLLRDTLNNQELFSELTEKRGIRGIILPEPLDFHLSLDPDRVLEALELVVLSHAGGSEVDSTWVLRRWKGKPEIAHKG